MAVQNTLKEIIKNAVGHDVARDPAFRKTMRLHQGWWRTFVLLEEEGVYKNSDVCSIIKEKQRSGHINPLIKAFTTKVLPLNFLNNTVVSVVEEVLNKRSKKATGIMALKRLEYNLLSSQPLCFNFFAELYRDKKFACQVLKCFIPHIAKVNDVMFEYAPKARYTNDNSAFDVAFEITVEGNKKGLLGLECKYTDDFSSKNSKHKYYGEPGNKNHNSYLRIFNNSRRHFHKSYDDYVKDKNYNQLFRNELIGQALLQNKKYDFVWTGLFCHHEDEHAVQIGKDFQAMLNNGCSCFKLITYINFIEKVQKLNLSLERREWTMMLWARYCANQLSRELSSLF